MFPPSFPCLPLYLLGSHYFLPDDCNSLLMVLHVSCFSHIYLILPPQVYQNHVSRAEIFVSPLFKILSRATVLQNKSKRPSLFQPHHPDEPNMTSHHSSVLSHLCAYLPLLIVHSLFEIYFALISPSDISSQGKEIHQPQPCIPRAHQGTYDSVLWLVV